MVCTYYYCFIGFILFLNFSKTKQALILAYKRFIYPAFFSNYANFDFCYSCSFPQEKIITYLNYGSDIFNIILAALIGSITAVPGFLFFSSSGHTERAWHILYHNRLFYDYTDDGRHRYLSC